MHNLFCKEVEQFKVELTMIPKRTKEQTSLLVLLDTFNWKVFDEFNDRYCRRCTSVNIETYLRLKALELQDQEELW